MLNFEKGKVSVVYVFLKLETITCRREAFITYSWGALCEQVALIQ